jgi:hypothetical protein
MVRSMKPQATITTVPCCRSCGETRLDTPGEHSLCADRTPVEQGVPKHLTKIPPDFWTWPEEDQLKFFKPMVRAIQADAARSAKPGPKAKP